VKKAGFILFFLLSFTLCFPQQRAIDSLDTKLRNSTSDSERASLYYKLGLFHFQDQQGAHYFHKGLALAKKLHNDTLAIRGMSNLNTYYDVMGRGDSCYFYIMQKMQLAKKNNLHRDIGTSYQELGYNFAMHYKNFNYYNKYIDSAIVELQKTSDTARLVYAMCRKLEGLISIGAPLEKVRHAMSDIDHLVKNKQENTSYLTFKVLYLLYNHEPDSAILLSSRLLKIYEMREDWRKLSFQFSKTADIYLQKNDLKNALSYSQKALDISETHHLTTEETYNLEQLLLIYQKSQDYKRALEISGKLQRNKDSSQQFTIQNMIRNYDEQIKNEKNKQDAELLKKQNELNEVKNTRQRMVIMFGVFVLAIVVFVCIFIFVRLRHSRLQNQIIENQRALVEEKNKAITDSIQYALRIQHSILPGPKVIEQHLKNSFIVYKPKDIVAGDFYWIEPVGDWLLFAACDCTGHGVPGALVSVMCHNALNRSVKEFGLVQPGVILDKTAEIIIDHFSKSEETIHDGMDISLCAYNMKTRVLEWAGANSPLWIVNQHACTELKADKLPIGLNDLNKKFTTHSLTLEGHETLYLFTDGFSDQFGGAGRGKKLTRRRFKELVLSIQDMPIKQQGPFLSEFITNYRSGLEQIDDILVIGVKF